MLIDILTRVNELRQKALSDPDFLQSAFEHEKVIKNMNVSINVKKRRKSLADIYENINSDFT